MVDWLNTILNEMRSEFPHPFTMIDANRISLPSDFNDIVFQSAGLFSSPNDLVTPLMGGQLKHTEFKSFYLRRSINEFPQRRENEAFFERLAKIIRKRNLSGNMPKDGRDWMSITVNAGIYPAQRDGAERWADYLVNLRLVYID
jgi:hypothetical protein